MDWLSDPAAWTALLTLTALELVLGIDNVVFLSILSQKLPNAQREKAKTVGLGLALAMRLLFLLALSWILKLSEPLFSALGKDFSGKDLILIGGGLFLLAKSTHEIHAKLEGDDSANEKSAPASFGKVILQIAVLNLVFSIDAIVTAIGMTEIMGVMAVSVLLSTALMALLAGPVGGFAERHPTVKMLALCFLLLIGTTLIAEGFHAHFPKGYVYFAMAFSVLVESLNMRIRASAPPLVLRRRIPG